MRGRKQIFLNTIMKHNSDHILTCIVHVQLSQQCLQLPSFSRENCSWQSSCSFAVSLCYHALVLSKTALERANCTMKLMESQDGTETEIFSGTPTSVQALMSQAVLLNWSCLFPLFHYFHPQCLCSQKTNSILKSKCLGIIHVQGKHWQACLLFSCLPHKISCSEVLLLW